MNEDRDSKQKMVVENDEISVDYSQRDRIGGHVYFENRGTKADGGLKAVELRVRRCGETNPEADLQIEIKISETFGTMPGKKSTSRTSYASFSLPTELVGDFVEAVTTRCNQAES